MGYQCCAAPICNPLPDLQYKYAPNQQFVERLSRSILFSKNEIYLIYLFVTKYQKSFVHTHLQISNKQSARKILFKNFQISRLFSNIPFFHHLNFSNENFNNVTLFLNIPSALNFKSYFCILSFLSIILYSIPNYQQFQKKFLSSIAIVQNIYHYFNYYFSFCTIKYENVFNFSFSHDWTFASQPSTELPFPTLQCTRPRKPTIKHINEVEK